MCYTALRNALIEREIDTRSMRAKRATIALLPAVVSCGACLLAIPDAAAGLYKCAGGDGIPVYQEAPCPNGRELRNLDADPPNLSVVPAPKPAPYPSIEREKPARQASARRVDRPGPWKTNPSPDPNERRHAYVGMSEGKVLALLGRPDKTSGGGRKGKVVWTYLPVPGDADTITTLSIDNGTVIYVDRRTVKR
jgi:hypothetical protein